MRKTSVKHYLSAFRKGNLEGSIPTLPSLVRPKIGFLAALRGDNVLPLDTTGSTLPERTLSVLNTRSSPAKSKIRLNHMTSLPLIRYNFEATRLTTSLATPGLESRLGNRREWLDLVVFLD